MHRPLRAVAPVSAMPIAADLGLDPRRLAGVPVGDLVPLSVLEVKELGQTTRPRLQEPAEFAKYALVKRHTRAVERERQLRKLAREAGDAKEKKKTKNQTNKGSNGGQPQPGLGAKVEAAEAEILNAQDGAGGASESNSIDAPPAAAAGQAVTKTKSLGPGENASSWADVPLLELVRIEPGAPPYRLYAYEYCPTRSKFLFDRRDPELLEALASHNLRIGILAQVLASTLDPIFEEHLPKRATLVRWWASWLASMVVCSVIVFGVLGVDPIGMFAPFQILPVGVCGLLIATGIVLARRIRRAWEAHRRQCWAACVAALETAVHDINNKIAVVEGCEREGDHAPIEVRLDCRNEGEDPFFDPRTSNLLLRHAEEHETINMAADNVRALAIAKTAKEDREIELQRREVLEARERLAKASHPTFNTILMPSQLVLRIDQKTASPPKSHTEARVVRQASSLGGERRQDCSKVREAPTLREPPEDICLRCRDIIRFSRERGLDLLAKRLCKSAEADHRDYAAHLARKLAKMAGEDVPDHLAIEGGPDHECGDAGESAAGELGEKSAAAGEVTALCSVCHTQLL